MDLLDYNTLIKYDLNRIHDVYEKWPELAKRYYEMNYDKISFKNIDHIIFTGMGGSGAIGDTLASILSKTGIHIDVVKGYHLPKTMDSNSLLVTTSASGNTLETLTTLRDAHKIKCKIISFSSGGKIADYCKKHKIEHRNVPILNSPRASFPVYLYSILNVLDDLIPVKKAIVCESIDILKKTHRKISSSNIENNPAIELAKQLRGIPIIYYPIGLYAAAIRFKNSLQENAKIHAITEDIMEACHNGIVAWEKPSVVQPILIQGKDDYVKTKQWWRIIKEYFKSNKIDYIEVHSVNGSILSKIINLVYFLDYTSIYYAIITKTDPTPVKSIDFIKKRLS